MSYAYDSFSFDDESSASCCPSSPSLAPCTPITMVGDLGFGIGSESPVVVPHPRFFIPSGGSEGIRSVPLPGVRCPKCAKDGKEVWVIPGRACGYCGTACG